MGFKDLFSKKEEPFATPLKEQIKTLVITLLVMAVMALIFYIIQ